MKARPMNDFLPIPPNGFFLAALDFETGGYDPKYCALTEYGLWAFRCQVGNPFPAAMFQAGERLNPCPNLHVSKQAADVQGRTMADIYSGKHKDEILAFHEFRILHEENGSPLLIAHNGDFEAGFLKAWAGRAGMPDWSEKKGGDVRRGIICTQRLTGFCRGVGILPPGKNDFDSALKEFNLTRDPKRNGHSATEDARLTAFLFCALYDRIRRYFGALAVGELETLTAATDPPTLTVSGSEMGIPGAFFHGQEAFRTIVLERIKDLSEMYGDKDNEGDAATRQAFGIVADNISRAGFALLPAEFPESILFRRETE